jgi:hypothetical protein
MPITVRWTTSAGSIPADLWAACFPPPLEGVWWYTNMEASGLDDQFTFAYAILEDAGRPIGIAPTFVMDVPLDVIAPDQLGALVRFVGRYVRFLRYQRTLFVGSPCADEGTVGLVPGVALVDVIGPLQETLDRRAAEVRASMIVYKDFAPHDVPALSTERRLFPVTSFPGTRLSLTDGYAGYLARLTSSHRHNLKKKLRRGSQAVPTVATVVQHPDAATLAEVWPLFWQTYLKGRTKFERLTPAFFDHIAAEPTSHFVLLRHSGSGQLVAFMLCFDCRPRMVNKFIGLDYGQPRDGNLYFQLWDVAVKWAADAGFAEVQSGQTGYRFKLDVGNELVPLTNFARHRNPLVHRLFAWQGRGITWATIDPDLKSYLAAHPQLAGEE